MKSLHSIAVVLGAVVAVATRLAGCSPAFSQVRLDLAAQGSRPLAVAVLDSRPYIHGGAGGKPPTFVGVQRSLGGVPFDVTTDTGRPMATDWSESIATALRSRGFAASEVPTNNSMERATVVSELARAADRSLFVSIHEWKVDAHFSGQIWYDIMVQVLDKDGKVRAERGVGGKDDFTADINGAAKARDSSQAEFKSKIEQLLNDPSIVAALGA